MLRRGWFAAAALAAVVAAILLRRRRRVPAAEVPAQPEARPEPAEPTALLSGVGKLSRTSSKLRLEPNVARFGLDIGGSLTKFIYLETEDQDDEVMARARKARKRAGLEPELQVEVPALGGRLHFAHFETQRVGKTVNMLKRHRLAEGVRRIHATGGGAHKYRRLIESTLGVPLSPCNELDAVVLGICLMAKAVSDECYTLESVANPHSTDMDPDGVNVSAGTNADTDVVAASSSEPVSADGSPHSVQRRPSVKVIPSISLGVAQPLRRITKFFSHGARDDFFPFLLCNVGTGVSILHVESERRYKRVSGTAVGGGTFLGLTRLLTKARKFQDALDVASGGDARRVDMLVDDIYGGSEERAGLNLPGDLTASFFAKNISESDGADPRGDVGDDDICKALVVMIAQNLAQVSTAWPCAPPAWSQGTHVPTLLALPPRRSRISTRAFTGRAASSSRGTFCVRMRYLCRAAPGRPRPHSRQPSCCGLAHVAACAANRRLHHATLVAARQLQVGRATHRGGLLSARGVLWGHRRISTDARR